MIDYYAAYSPYAMLLIAATVICIILGAFLCAYGVVKVGKGPLFWLVIIILLGFLFLPVTGFMVLVSPSIKLQELYLNLQRYIALFTTVPLLFILFSMYRRGCRLKQCGVFGLVFLIHTVCVFYLWGSRSGVLADYLPVLNFGFFSMFLISARISFFVELSPVSIDNFMQELKDTILIFDKNGKLIDANEEANKLWPFLHDGLTINEFLENLKAITILNKCSEKNGLIQYGEVVLSFPGGIRHYQYSTTQVMDKMGSIQAAVLNFHDITEKSLLEKELAEKNEELEKLNMQLITFLDTAEKLLEEEEKAKISKDINEMIGNRIEKLLAELEGVSLGNKQEELPELIENCREVMAGVRFAIQKLMPDRGKDEKHD